MEKQKTYPSQYEKVKQISEQLEQGILNLFDNDDLSESSNSEEDY